MFRHILTVEQVPNEVVSKMTLHGLRLWAAEMAYQTKVPRDLRKYIGHWSQEETADTYTREHASIITKIWAHIFDQYDSADLRPGDRPVDPSHEEYMGEDVGTAAPLPTRQEEALPKSDESLTTPTRSGKERPPKAGGPRR